ncbi:MAG: UDP-N-acetylmuramoyl-L-alanine--D-glutamate ligase [Clostridiales bacterium]|nr:UDP-N-acetylmuramoyl-L-alanine--D-glutamate ligase [Clostridiales bacterium]
MSRTSDRFKAYFENKKILILGFGKEGRSSYEFIRKILPEKPLAIADMKDIELKDDKVRLITGEDYLSHLSEFDLVLKSPGIPFKGVKIPEGVEITCQTDLFLRFSDFTAIGITGTKGKTTTSTLIYSMLREAGFDACLIGNIGVPVFEDIDMAQSAVAVIELSSHQLQFTRTSPHIAVLTNIYEEHLDHYDGGFAGYVSAKLNIVRHQTENDCFIYNGEQDLNEYIDMSDVKSRKIPVKSLSDEEFLNNLTKGNPHLKGRHNLHDVLFAANAVRCLGVSDEAIKRAVDNFQGIEHRMEFVGSFDGVDYYNDCIATIPKAVLSAVEALDVGSLIIGGLDRGLDYTEFAKALAESSIDNLICLPDTGYTIGRLVDSLGAKTRIIYAKDMEDAVRQAKLYTPKGKACLLSPAAASYNLYKGFEEKGRHYKKLVMEICGLGA